MSNTTDDASPNDWVPPNEQLVHEAEQQEARFCSLMLKHTDLIKEAVGTGLTAGHFWTPRYATVYGMAASYWQKYGERMGVGSYRDICNKAAKEPEETTRRMQDYHDTYALHVERDEFKFLKEQIVARDVQRQACKIVDDYSTKLMKAKSNQQTLVAEFSEAVGAIRLTHNRPVIRKLEEFSLGADNGGCLLGNRLLCRGDDMLIAAHAGAGKSVFIMQKALCLAAGDDFLGIKPVAPLRILIVQAENSDGDLAEQRDHVLRFLGWGEEKAKAARQNIRFVCEPGVAGEAVPRWLDGILGAWTPDICILDPLFGFLGGDVSYQPTVSRFIRTGLKPLWQKYRCGHIMCHHTNKPVTNKDKRLSGLDLLYAYSGSAELANSYRAGACIHRISATGTMERTYGFMIPKRGQRAGWRNDAGEAVFSVECRWSTKHGQWGWEPFNSGLADTNPANLQSKTAKPEKPVKPELEAADILRLLPQPPQSFTRIHFLGLASEKMKIGRNRAMGWLEILLHEQKIVQAGKEAGTTRPRDLYQIAHNGDLTTPWN